MRLAGTNSRRPPIAARRPITGRQRVRQVEPGDEVVDAPEPLAG